MANYRFGRYSKSNKDKTETIVIDSKTDSKLVEEFLKGCDEGTAKRIKQGNSKGSLSMMADADKKAKVPVKKES